MARIEHANIVVTQLETTSRFLMTAFPHWKVRDGGESAWAGKPRRWVHLGDDVTYLTLNDNGEGKPRALDGHQPGLAHLGFEVTGLDDLVQRLVDAGYAISHAGDHTAHRRNVYFVDDEGLEFEFVEYASDDPAQRNE